jgi:hypothetical protein
MALAACSTARGINARRVAQLFKASGFAFCSFRSFELENTALSMLHRTATLAGNSPENVTQQENVSRSFLVQCAAVWDFIVKTAQPKCDATSNESLPNAVHLTHIYEIRPRKDHRGFDLISDALPFGGLWYTQVLDAVEYAKHRSRSHDAVICVYDDAGNVIETHEHKGEFREW